MAYKQIMKESIIKKRSLVSFSLIITVISFFFYAYEDGITGKTLKSSEPGCTCHSETQSSQVNVIIEGPDFLSPGETASYSILINGGPLIKGGTNIAASAGTLQPGDGLQKIGSELTHTMPREPMGGEVVFDFTYTAPTTPGTITLYANGNSVNYSGTEYGDAWNFAENKIIAINTLADVEDDIERKDFYLEQNYPNPFNPVTYVRFNVEKSGIISLKVYDVLGNEISTLINEEKQPGIYDVEFNAEGLSSGIYYYTLIAENYTSVKKMLLMK